MYSFGTLMTIWLQLVWCGMLEMLFILLMSYDQQDCGS